MGRGWGWWGGWGRLVVLPFLSVLACSMEGHGNQSGRVGKSQFGLKTGCFINVPG